MIVEGTKSGYTLRLSANNTHDWACRAGSVWPCSVLNNRRVRVEVDANGIVDLAIDGKSGDCGSDELEAIVSDHLPAEYRHLWPTWESAK